MRNRTLLLGPPLNSKVCDRPGGLELDSHVLRFIRVFQIAGYAYFRLIAARNIDVAVR
jgi:hypothetical protein